MKTDKYSSPDPEDENDIVYEDDPCNWCGYTGRHALSCPENEEPFARLIQDGYD